MNVDAAAAVVRAIGLVAVLQSIGAGAFAALFADVEASRTALQRLGIAATLVAAATITVQLGLDAARMAGSLAGWRDPEMQAIAWHAGSTVWLVRVGGLLLAGLAWTLAPRRGWRALAGVAALLLAVSFGLGGHAAMRTDIPALGVLIATHALLAGFWFGGLIPLIATTRLESATRAARIVERFSAVATLSVPCIAAIGVAVAWLVGVRAESLLRPYGQLLLAKAGLFTGLMVLAALNKWRLAPRLATDASAGARFRIVVVAEMVLIVAVLVVTAVLTTYYSPED